MCSNNRINAEHVWAIGLLEKRLIVNCDSENVNFRDMICARSGGIGDCSVTLRKTISQDLPTMCLATVSKQNISAIFVSSDARNLSLYLNLYPSQLHDSQ